MIRMSVTVQPTLWDDAYFNLKTAKIVLIEELTEQSVEVLKKKSEGFDFVVIDNYKGSLKNDRILSSIENNFLCDIQVNFSLLCEKVSAKTSPFALVQNNLNSLEQLLTISESVFQFSRFKIDPFLDEKKSQALYRKWCEDAFKNENKYFLIHSAGDEINGYILFHNEEFLVIELIAVQTKKQRNGIGGEMIDHLIRFCQEKGINKIKVGTQANNKQAIRFYQQKGFILENIHTIYHYWPHK